MTILSTLLIAKNGLKLFSVREEDWYVSWVCIRLNHTHTKTEPVFGYGALNMSNCGNKFETIIYNIKLHSHHIDFHYMDILRKPTPTEQVGVA